MNTSPALPFRRLVIDARTSVHLPQGRAVVVLVPHPDDEVLGCGLLIARLVRAGIRVVMIALTDGDASHPGSRRWPPAVLARVRRAELRRALHRLGAARASLRFMGWHDGKLAAEARQFQVAALCHAMGAGVILAASPDDHHLDHKACFALGAGVASRLRLPLVSYAVWSRLADQPGRSTGDRHRAAKNWAIAAHRSQVSDYVADAPDGFRLSDAALRQFIGQAERYSRVASHGVKRPHSGREPE